jgi:hypothetical protein
MLTTAFSMSVRSNILASLELEPPASMSVPSILENYPEYRNTGSLDVLRLESQSTVVINLQFLRSHIWS